MAIVPVTVDVCCRQMENHHGRLHYGKGQIAHSLIRQSQTSSRLLVPNSSQLPPSFVSPINIM